MTTCIDHVWRESEMLSPGDEIDRRPITMSSNVSFLVNMSGRRGN